MADGIAITPGSGVTVWTDDCGAAGHAQAIKLGISSDGAATFIPADAANGLDVDVTRISGTVTVALAVPTTATDIALASTTASTQVLAANGTRTNLCLRNTDANEVYLKCGTTASATSNFVTIPSGGTWEMPSPPWRGVIHAVWAADGSGSLIGQELS